jgi:hypothetical protein
MKTILLLILTATVCIAQEPAPLITPDPQKTADQKTIEEINKCVKTIRNCMVSNMARITVLIENNPYGLTKSQVVADYGPAKAKSLSDVAAQLKILLTTYDTTQPTPQPSATPSPTATP